MGGVLSGLPNSGAMSGSCPYVFITVPADPYGEKFRKGWYAPKPAA